MRICLFLYFVVFCSAQQYQTIEETLFNRTCVYFRDVAGFIDYWWLVHCVTTPPVQSVLLSLWLIYLLYIMVSTTHKYFGNAVSRMTEKLRLSSHIFGVTFLAISFVSGDFFVSVAGVYHRNNDLALGGLLGSSFLTLTFASFIAIFLHKDKAIPTVPRRPFCRDILFLVISTLVVGLFWLKNEVMLWQGILMITIYLFYLLIVLVGRFVYQREKLQQRTELGILEDADDVLFEMSPETDFDHVMFFADIRENSNRPLNVEHELSFNVDDEEISYCTHLTTFWRQLIYDGSEWNEKTIFHKLIFILLAPSIIVRNLTIPTGAGIIWSKPLFLINCFTVPQFLLITSETIYKTIPFGTFQFPLWGLLLIISAVLALVVFFTSTIKEPPKYYSVLIGLNIIMSSAWLYIVGLELISGLTVLCMSMHTSLSTGGLIYLGFANSFIAITSIGKLTHQGYVNLAIPSILAVIPLKLMFCLGFSIVFASALTGDKGIYFSENAPNPFVLMLISLVVVGVVYLVLLPIFRFKLKSVFGFVPLILGVTVLVVVILAEFQILFPNPIVNKSMLGF